MGSRRKDLTAETERWKGIAEGADSATRPKMMLMKTTVLCQRMSKAARDADTGHRWASFGHTAVVSLSCYDRVRTFDAYTFTFLTLQHRHPPLVFLCGFRFLWSFRWFGASSEKTWKFPIMSEAR